ncbi:hypothetical protein SAMN04487905_102387 [Actinopolyspora xinjiangensis]|uniref:Uncharacterized protein n=1 Tax=Actinopolyspora xinjiangensis TaxID=405564 RepID=A0A1H0QT98_9ACTN|nr:hypothetical protein [Actinopolyspora xinjiangensis]SDP20561.1 hypothetical protein SAMN04487905_102387 [Actinopolyspora xinjiangensis]
MGRDNKVFQSLSRREHFWRIVGAMPGPAGVLAMNLLNFPIWLELSTASVVLAGSVFLLRRFTTMESAATGPMRPEKWRFGFPDRSTLRPGKYRSGRTGDGI